MMDVNLMMMHVVAVNTVPNGVKLAILLGVDIIPPLDLYSLQNLGNAFTGIRHLWYPTVGADGPCKLEINFGDGERQFRYSEARGFGPTGPVRK